MGAELAHPAHAVLIGVCLPANGLTWTRAQSAKSIHCCVAGSGSGAACGPAAVLPVRRLQRPHGPGHQLRQEGRDVLPALQRVGRPCPCSPGLVASCISTCWCSCRGPLLHAPAAAGPLDRRCAVVHQQLRQAARCDGCRKLCGECGKPPHPGADCAAAAVGAHLASDAGVH